MWDLGEVKVLKIYFAEDGASLVGTILSIRNLLYETGGSHW